MFIQTSVRFLCLHVPINMVQPTICPSSVIVRCMFNSIKIDDMLKNILFEFHALEKEMATHSSVLAWRIQGWESLAGCRLWGCTESDKT